MAGAVAHNDSGGVGPEGIDKGVVRHPVPQAPPAATVRRDHPATGWPTDVEALVLAREDRSLADSTVRSAYTVLRAALRRGARRALARNPAAVKRPGVERARPALTARSRRCEPPRVTGTPVLALIAATGLRRGEALALQWDRRRPRRRAAEGRGTWRASTAS